MAMIMFDEYCKFTATTDIYPMECKPWVYALGLSGETGEVCDKLKKTYRDANGVFNKEKCEELAKELGDVLWYLSRLSNCLGFSLSEIAQMNVDKLNSRKARGKLTGSGDNR